MSRNDLWKWLVFAFLAILSAFVVYPPKEKIRLGLDLSGGTSFTVAIDEERLRANIKAEDPSLADSDVQNKINAHLQDADTRAVEIIRNRIDGLGINEPVIQGGKNHRIVIQLPGTSPVQRDAAEKSIQSAAFLEFKLVHAQNDSLVDKVYTSGRLPEGYVKADSGRGFKRAGNYNELVKDPDYARRLSLFEVPDPRYAFMLEREQNANGSVSYAPIFVLRKAEMTGDALSSAFVDREHMTGRVHVSLTFNAEGTSQFAKLTKDYAPRGARNKNSDIGRRLAIVLDDTLYSAPVLKTEIPNGKAVIEGNFSWSEAALLRNILNAGSLPAPMKILEKRDISPTLGRDAINSGIKSGAVGIMIVMAFMLVYYKYCGLIANVALILNLFLLPAGLIFASNILGVFVTDSAGGAKTLMSLPVLTMPGIAGIVLTLGMAVDANVLIFERMREEFAMGKSPHTGVAAGYNRAFTAIFDSNLTTLLVAAILFIFGAGPLRGYAITLSAGIIISMFTALVVTRLIFNATVSETRAKPLAMLQIFKSPNFDFLKPAKLCIVTSLAIIVVTCALFLIRAFKEPASVMTVDFVGGAAITFSCKEKVGTGDIHSTIVPAVVNDATIQYQSVPGKEDVLLIMTSQITVNDANSSTLILKALTEKFPQCEFQTISADTVGAVVGKDLKRAAFWATALSLLGILVYISLRFEFGFALGAVIALIHDAFFSLGIYSLFGHQISLTAMAALLTVIGYSINDSIVILDRIREDLRKDAKMDFTTLCSRAINATLSRTVLTSGTTLFVVLALYLFGGGAINDFALMMLLGVMIGTYSSIFIVTPVTLYWYRGRRPAFATSK